MLTENCFAAGPVHIHYVEGPSTGPPLVLLHGVTTRWQTFLPAMSGLMARYHIYALDLRGHGRSSWTPGAYSIDDDAADVIRLLRTCVPAPAVVLGWSLGGMVATLVAAQAPDLVHAVVLEDPPLATFTDDDSSQAEFYVRFRELREVMMLAGSARERLAALATIRPELDELQLRRRAKELSQCDPEGLTLIIEKRKFAAHRLEALLPTITCPVLLLQGNTALGAAVRFTDIISR
jgi:pimeloyl-ACP methyl ester carboxylesterase